MTSSRLSIHMMQYYCVTSSFELISMVDNTYTPHYVLSDQIGAMNDDVVGILKTFVWVNCLFLCCFVSWINRLPLGDWHKEKKNCLELISATHAFVYNQLICVGLLYSEQFFNHCNGNVVISTTYPSLAALDAVWQLPVNDKNVVKHYNNIMMSAMASQITCVSVVCSIVCSGANQRKLQSSASLAFVREIYRKNVFIRWRHHEMATFSFLFLTWLLYNDTFSTHTIKKIMQRHRINCIILYHRSVDVSFFSTLCLIWKQRNHKSSA